MKPYYLIVTESLHCIYVDYTTTSVNTGGSFVTLHRARQPS